MPSCASALGRSLAIHDEDLDNAPHLRPPCLDRNTTHTVFSSWSGPPPRCPAPLSSATHGQRIRAWAPRPAWPIEDGFHLPSVSGLRVAVMLCSKRSKRRRRKGIEWHSHASKRCTTSTFHSFNAFSGYQKPLAVSFVRTSTTTSWLAPASNRSSATTAQALVHLLRLLVVLVTREPIVTINYRRPARSSVPSHLWVSRILVRNCIVIDYSILTHATSREHHPVPRRLRLCIVFCNTRGFASRPV